MDMSKAWTGKIHDFRKYNTLILKRNLRCFRRVGVGREEGVYNYLHYSTFLNYDTTVAPPTPPPTHPSFQP